MSLVAFWACESVNCLGGNRGLIEPSDFMKNILICVLKMNEGLTEIHCPISKVIKTISLNYYYNKKKNN